MVFNYKELKKIFNTGLLAVLPISVTAFIVEELLKAGKIDNCEDKLKFFLLTGQLSKEQIDSISEIGVSTIPEL